MTLLRIWNCGYPPRKAPQIVSKRLKACQSAPATTVRPEVASARESRKKYSRVLKSSQRASPSVVGQPKCAVEKNKKRQPDLSGCGQNRPKQDTRTKARGEICPEAVKDRQTPPHQLREREISPRADNSGHLRTGLAFLALLVGTACPAAEPDKSAVETSAGWVKYDKNPVLGGKLGTCFDISVLKESDGYRMWFSWRPKKSIALVESKDGMEWSKPTIVLGPNPQTDWESDVNRPVVIKDGDGYRMWYTGQARGRSWIGYATSADGKNWQRMSAKPVLSPEQAWEKVAVMCPHVIYDDAMKQYRMWYSGGEQYEPNAIGYATSADGLRWTKHESNPVFKADPKSEWEKDRVTACQVIRQGDWYLMFYIGFRDEHRAQIGVARSKDGISGWQRHPANPIIRPGTGKWDHDAVYKPCAIFDGQRWLLWYNGRKGGVEQIGLATHYGEDLGFELSREGR